MDLDLYCWWVEIGETKWWIFIDNAFNLLKQTSLIFFFGFLLNILLDIKQKNNIEFYIFFFFVQMMIQRRFVKFLFDPA